MKLTPKETQICKKYKKRDEAGYVRCYECPLNITDDFGLECYATIDGRSTRARGLKRYDD